MSGVYRILVVADEGLTAPSFTEALAEHAGGRPVEALVVAPALGSWLSHGTGDDAGRADAERRLEETTASLRAAGIGVRSQIGSDDPIQAADDGLREFPADEVVLVTARKGGANWLERGVVDSARSRYDVPVTHIEV